MVIAKGEPLTGALEMAPALAIVALVTVSPFTRPLDTNSVPAKVMFCP